jgi:hypothetical protein
MYFIVSTLSLTSGLIWRALGTWALVNYFSGALALFGIVAMVAVACYEWSK